MYKGTITATPVSLPPDSFIATSTTIEYIPPTTSTTVESIAEQVAAPDSTVPVSTTATSAPRTSVRGNRSTPRVKSQSQSRDDRCQQAIADANVKAAPNYYFVCGPEEEYNTPTDGGVCPYYESSDDEVNDFYECEEGMHPGDIRIHPDDWDSDDEWMYTVKHEVGHTWCVYLQQNYTEQCADDWAQAH